jgi:hypothetical protein
MIEIERLRQLLNYEPTTGVFTRRLAIGRRSKVGDVAGYVDRSHGYVSLSVDGREYYAHVLAVAYVTGEWPAPHTVDHRNRKRSDNRWSNLRRCVRKTNNRNLSKQVRRTSTLKGVTWHKGGQKWMAQIHADGKRQYLGLFEDERKAHEAYAVAAAKLHGDFASW